MSKKRPEFLERKYVNNSLGLFFPEKLRLFEGGKEEDFQFLKNQEIGSVLFFTSESCGSCRYDSINQFSNTYLLFNYILFLDAPMNLVSDIVNEYEFRMPVVQTDLREIMKVFTSEYVPFVLGLNKIGQICCAGYFNNDIQSLSSILTPLLRTYYPDERISD